MKASAARWSAALFVGVAALALTGCKNSRNDMADAAESQRFDQVGEVRVYDEPRVAARAETPKVDLKKVSRRESRAVASQRRYDRIGEMDVAD